MGIPNDALYWILMSAIGLTVVSKVVTLFFIKQPDRLLRLKTLDLCLICIATMVVFLIMLNNGSPR